MKYKIVVWPIGQREKLSTQFFETESTLLASEHHAEMWNRKFAFSDRYRSALYFFDKVSRRWLRTETINW